MNGVMLCIHRASNTIGGNSIEIVASTGERIILDAGRPLDTPDNTPAPVPPSLDTRKPVSGILLSHAHADHCGMLESLPASWPVYCGPATETLLRLSVGITGKNIQQQCFPWTNGKTVFIGSFSVTPYLIDHSAFDAYAVHIEASGKHILYSGDFRAQGRKGKLTHALMQKPPRPLDVLIMEGTNLPAKGGAVKPTPSEEALEEDFVRLFRETKGRVFVSWSSTNIDRFVTLFRACKKSGRVLVPDLFCMMVLLRLKEFGKIPQPDWGGGHMCAVVTKRMANLAKRMGEGNLVEYLKSCRAAMSAAKLAEHPHKWVIMARDSLVEDFHKKGIIPTDEDTWIWSMWTGYLWQESTKLSREFFAPCRQENIHTSGHASPELLQTFAEAMRPDMLIPVHGEGWQAWAEHFPNLRAAADGEWLELDT